MTDPFLWIEVQIFDLAMLEEAGQANAIVCQVWLLAYHYDVVFAPIHVKFHDLFSGATLASWRKKEQEMVKVT